MGRKVAVGLGVLVGGGAVATTGFGEMVLVAVGASVAVGVPVGVAVIVAVSLGLGVGVVVAVGVWALAVKSATARVCSAARVASCASMVSKPFANTVATAGSGEAVAVGICTVGAPQAAKKAMDAIQINSRIREAVNYWALRHLVWPQAKALVTRRIHPSTVSSQCCALQAAA